MKNSGENKERDISLWIDHYDDLFSDFDPRPFSERSFSDDFIAQVKKVSKDSGDQISSLKLLAPEGIRNKEHEYVIKKRLQGHFKKRHKQIRKEWKKARMKGISMTLTGVLLMIIASYIDYEEITGFLVTMILVVIEPASWFLLWTGLDDMISFSRNRKSDIEFYKKMTNVDVEFGTYN